MSKLAAWFISRDLSRRDFALDVFRGLLIFGMILVNHPPPGVPVYAQLTHAAWNGWTFADTIFPGFLFAVGVSVHFSVSATAATGVDYRFGAYSKITRRFLLLMVINYLLVNFPYYFVGPPYPYFAGTLALIAWCYLAAALVRLHCGWRLQVATVVLSLALQWALLALLPVPGHGAGLITPDANAASYIDRLLIVPVFGESRFVDFSIVILPTIGAIATTLLGVLAGRWIRGSGTPFRRVGGLFAGGVCLCLLASVWNPLLPVNKPLWTGSFVALMSGISAQTLAIIMWVTEQRGYRRWARPLVVGGVNALFFYVFAQGLQRVLVFGRVQNAEGTKTRLRTFIYNDYFAPWVNGEAGALAYTLAFMAVCYLMALLLYRRHILVKI
jgi:predicted acyltransferase